MLSSGKGLYRILSCSERYPYEGERVYFTFNVPVSGTYISVESLLCKYSVRDSSGGFDSGILYFPALVVFNSSLDSQLFL